MRNNDLSNHSAPYIAFDIDSLLFIEKPTKGIFNQIKDMFKSPNKAYTKREYNMLFVNTLLNLWEKHDITIIFLTNEWEEDNLPELAEKLDHDLIPFSHLISYENWETVRNYTKGTFQYIFSSNPEFISYMSFSNSMHFDRVKEVFGG